VTLAGYRGERVLVLGASGFVGAWIARSLASASAELHVASRAPTPELAPAQHHALDAFADGALEALLARLRPRFVFNAIGYGVDPRERDEALAWRANAELPRALATACSALAAVQPVTLVQVGSMAEVGPSVNEFAEDGPCAPASAYGRSKLAGTDAIRAACAGGALRGGTGRLFMVYGPGEHAGRLLPSLLETARTRVPLDLSEGLQERDFTYVAEAAEGLMRLGLLNLRGDVVNIASGAVHSIRAFAETAADVLGFPRELLRFGARPTNAHDAMRGRVTSERLRRLTDWSPRLGIAAGIAETARFLEKQHESGAS
jgi:nucleoside-diphosphate-sugar epimerase